jgi:hypothetical protein
MDPVVTGGLIGIAGTLIGVGTQEALANWRESRRNRRLRMRAVTAIASELISTVSILDKALERQAWWPEGDEPRSEAFQRYHDALGGGARRGDEYAPRIVYDTIRSLTATRSSPLTPVSRGRLKRLLRDDPQGRLFFSLIWMVDRWPTAAEETQQTRDVVWAFLTEDLWPAQKRLLGDAATRHWQPPEDSS